MRKISYLKNINYSPSAEEWKDKVLFLEKTSERNSSSREVRNNVS